jgi:hypothetical protein
VRRACLGSSVTKLTCSLDSDDDIPEYTRDKRIGRRQTEANGRQRRANMNEVQAEHAEHFLHDSNFFHHVERTRTGSFFRAGIIHECIFLCEIHSRESLASNGWYTTRRVSHQRKHSASRTVGATRTLQSAMHDQRS